MNELCFRITGFDDSWSKLEKWFNKFGILAKVDVDNTIGTFSFLVLRDKMTISALSKTRI
jgi:hypothetical protein